MFQVKSPNSKPEIKYEGFGRRHLLIGGLGGDPWTSPKSGPERRAFCCTWGQVCRLRLRIFCYILLLSNIETFRRYVVDIVMHVVALISTLQ